MRAVVVILGVLGLLATGGCDDSGTRPVAAQTASTPSASSTPSAPSAPRTPSRTPSSPTGPGKVPSSQPAPTRLTVAQARSRYLAVTRPYNVALERFEKAANSGASVRTLRTRARAVAAANLAESRLLLSTAWPTSVRRSTQELARADASARQHWLRVAAADTLTEMARHLRRAVAAGGKEPAADIRRRLGLPKYDESDYS
jgi:hypothetical protein